MADDPSEPAFATAPFRDAPRGGTALVIIDMITTLDFTDTDRMLEDAEAAADADQTLRDAADAAEFPVIYVNDNFGEWHSERSRLIDRGMEEAFQGRGIAAKLRPRECDFFVIKPQFSGFYATNLPVLLPKLGIDRLVLTGIAADICVLFTAADAHMRDYALWVPADAVAARTRDRHHWALEIMKRAMGAEIRPTAEMSLQEWADQGGESAHDTPQQLRKSQAQHEPA